jgi:peptidoglycan hydrolase-like protein with peptidoglycan-binding domain
MTAGVGSAAERPTSMRDRGKVPVESQARARITPFESRERLDGRATGTRPAYAGKLETMTAFPRRIGWIATLLLSALALVAAGASTASAARRERASKQTVLRAQRLFRELHYPLGRDRPGDLGVGTRGALEYFQRKYGLSASGYPNATTLTLMEGVEASLRAPSSSAPGPTAPISAIAVPSGRASYPASAQPRDLVERLLGEHLPLLAIAIALASLLSLLALSARRASGYRSAKTRGSTTTASGGG